MRPVNTDASSSSRCVMPELFMKLPARMNSGTASSAKFCVCVIVSCTGIVGGSSGCCRKKTVPEMPIANATGMPINSSTAKTRSTSSICEQADVTLGRGTVRARLAAPFVAHLEQRRDEQQHRADRHAHRHPRIADLRDALEAAHAARPRQPHAEHHHVEQERRDDRVVEQPQRRLPARREARRDELDRHQAVLAPCDVGAQEAGPGEQARRCVGAPVQRIAEHAAHAAREKSARPSAPGTRQR